MLALALYYCFVVYSYCNLSCLQYAVVYEVVVGGGDEKKHGQYLKRNKT